MEKSTLEIFEKVEGRKPSAAEKLALKNMGDDNLEKFYTEVQSDFTRMRQADKSPEDQEQDQLKTALKDMGFVSRDDMEKEKHDEEQLRLYLAQDPSAKERLGLIKTLSKTAEFAGKSFPDIDAFVKENSGFRPETNGASKPTAMGNNNNQQPQSPTEMSDEDFAASFSDSNGQMLSRR